MKKYICECCGGEIDRATMKCLYCGTPYREEFDRPIRIETFRNPVKTFNACIEVTDEMMRDKDGAEYALSVLAKELANAIPPMMEVRYESNPVWHTARLRGTIKIVQPVNVSDI